MSKVFNIEGWCDPEKHFVADVSAKVEEVMAMVEDGKYFTINRPHQYGKTSMLETINFRFREASEWLVFNISFEGTEDRVFADGVLFSKFFLNLLRRQMLEQDEDELAVFLKNMIPSISFMSDLNEVITDFAYKANRKMLLLIDEVDSSSSQEVFLRFLGLLRSKYLKRHLKTERSFHSVVLVGVHDIKSLKLKISPNETTQNSPWNIAADFEVRMSLKVEEIIPMLEDYSSERNVKLDSKILAENLIYYTSGYPFLVSALCKIVDEKVLPKKYANADSHIEIEWTERDLELAVNQLISKTNTNFDHLKKSLKNNTKLYDLTHQIAVYNQEVLFNIHDETTSIGLMYGIFKRSQHRQGYLQIHNLIYQSVIFDFMIGQIDSEIRSINTPYAGIYSLPDHQLNMELVLEKFQIMMKEHYSRKDRDFLERHGRLVLLSFLKPIINGGGFAFAEPQFSDEKKLDIAITYYQHKYILELKIWRGEKSHQEGLKQLATYLNHHHQEIGYLIIYDHRQKKSWEQKWFEISGKRIFAVWV